MGQYKFNRNIDIGSLDAENDKFLFNAFVDKNDYSILCDMSDRKCIVLGRTGSGKSALLRYLENNKENVVRIDPESMSLRHLSNSNIITYFQSLNVKLDLFYKVLWKHVFIVELIKLYFNNSTSKGNNILEWIKEKLPDKKRKLSIEYLEKWEDKFWEDTEYRIKELEQSLENRFKDELGGKVGFPDFLSILGKKSEEISNSQTVKWEIINKAQKVVNESQIEHIESILEMLRKELFPKTQKKYFIIIDDLDKEWVSNTIVYDLLKALIETIKVMSEIPNVKIIIALRTNIHKKLIKTNISRGIQREKYNHLYLDLIWTKEELKQLLNYRLRELMKGTYTNEHPTVEEVLPMANKKQIDGFDYMIERSIMRPREIIDFFNKCIKYADGKTKISREIIKDAEDEYSHDRLRALNDEWLENYGNIHCLYGFIKNVQNGFKMREVETVAEEYFIDVIASDRIKTVCDEFKQYFTQFGEKFDTVTLLKKILILSYEIGLLGIKISPDKPLEYIYESYSAIEIIDLNDDSKFYIHPMYHKALRVKN